jgi:excisionase family DNA binding protein
MTARAKKKNAAQPAPSPLPDLTKPQLLTYTEVSAVTKVSIATLERMVRDGELPTAPFPRGTRFRPLDILRFIVEPSNAEASAPEKQP